ncbi:MAG: response regulator transcription factor [Elusimicrobiota bacterium]
MARILYVEDSEPAARFIKDALSPAGHELQHACDLREGWYYARKLEPTLLIIDVNLPDGSGIDLCRQVRGHPKLAHTPVIMLTAKGELQDKALGFESGADHYLVKPLEAKELQLWVEALLRRVDFVDAGQGILRGEDIVLDPQRHAVTLAESAVGDLTRKEFDLLYELVRRSPKILSKKYILSKLWHATLRDNTVESHIRNLRRKLGEAACRVVTVPGVGYRFD